jgi:hypothetical protein
VRLVKLAFRIAVEYRRSLFATAAALVLVSIVATAGGSVLASLGTATHDFVRLRWGDYRGELAPPVYAELQSRLDAGVSMSAAVPESAAFSVGGQLILVQLAWVDLARELAYRRLPAPDTINPNDGVLIGGAGSIAELEGRVARATASRSGTTFVRIRQVHPQGDGQATVLVHAPGRLEEQPVTVRFTERPSAVDDSGLDGIAVARSDWRSDASRILSPLRTRFAFLIAALILISGAVLLPAQIVLARRTLRIHRLLVVWGFNARERALLIHLIGASIGAVASIAGSLIGMLIVSVLNAGEASALELLPFAWRESFDLILATPATPSMGWALATIGLSTLLGVVTAFPTAPFVATLLSRRSVWN